MMFVGIIWRIHTICQALTNGWQTNVNASYLHQKPLFDTAWQCRFGNMGAIRHQTSWLRNSVLEVAKNSNASKLKRGSVPSKLWIQKFLISGSSYVEWLSFAVNAVSKTLQTKEMQIDLTFTQIKRFKNFLRKLEETEYASAMDVDPKFRELFAKRKRND
jgi:hypothetical protein